MQIAVGKVEGIIKRRNRLGAGGPSLASKEDHFDGTGMASNVPGLAK